MADTYYPRQGYSLAPRALKKILTVPLPDWAKRKGKAYLADLDETSWQTYSETECLELAESIIESIGSLSNLDPESLDSYVFWSKESTRVPCALDFSTRTRNCLGRSGILNETGVSSPLRIGDLAAIPYFGAKCLLEFLSEVEAINPSRLSVEEIQTVNMKLNKELQDEIRTVQEHADILEIRVHDPRFGSYLRTIPMDGANLGDMLESITRIGVIGASAQAVLEALRDIRQSVLKKQLLSLEDEVDEILESFHMSERNKKILIDKTGIDGAGKKTLQEVGDHFGLTRERIRQITDRDFGRLGMTGCFAPITEKALITLGDIAPCLVENADAALADSGITHGGGNARAVLAAASLFGKLPSVDIVTIGCGEFVLRKDEEEIPALILSTVEKQSTKYGALNCAEISASLEAETGKPVEVEFVRQVVDMSFSDLSWLDDIQGWFWLNSTLGTDNFCLSRNRLVNQIRKVLSVADRIHVGELREGIRRTHRMNGFAPPKAVLLAMAAQLDFCTIEGEFLVPGEQLDFQQLFGQTEVKMVEVLRKNGSVMAREQMERECVAEGVNRNSFYVYLGNSPVIEKYAVGVYGIRGADIPPGYASSMVRKKKPGKILIDHGWTDDRRVWVGYRVSDPMAVSGVFSIPASLRETICPVATRYKVFSEDGTYITEISCKEATGWCLSPLFTRRGVESGDCLTLLFDAVEGIVTAEIGEERLLQYMDGAT